MTDVFVLVVLMAAKNREQHRKPADLKAWSWKELRMLLHCLVTSTEQQEQLSHS
jgi:hypothetical protein